MPSSFEKDIINIINSSLKGTSPRLSENFNFELAYKLGVNHQIVPLIYYGISDCQGLGGSLGAKFMMTSASLAQYSELQLSEAERFFCELEMAKIPYLKMKGTILKKLYRYSEMRMMSDIDVYTHPEKYDQVKKILENLGFVFATESNHEIIWEKGKVVIEIHKRLIPSYTKDLYEYYGDSPWDRLLLVDENRTEYEMNVNDTFIYLFMHFSKHYRDGGIGIKFLTDFYVFMEKNALDYSYIEGELEKMGLLDFYKNVKKVLDVWFFDAEGDEITDFITDKIFASSTYGEKKAKLEAEALRLSLQEKDAKKGKRKRKLQMIFPSYSQMCLKYPFLKGWAILLPLMWVVRIISALFTKRKNAVEAMNKLDSVSDEQIKKYDAELHFVGFPYNF